jgi:hypothetical protein
MSIRVDTKRSNFYNELSEFERKKYFNLKEKKYLHNIDTLYYSIFIKEDSNDDEHVKHFVEEIKELKQNLMLSNEESLDFLEDMEVMMGRHADYTCRLSVRDCYDIFITTHIRNSNTPRILVQIRSFYLWIEGVENAINKSYERVKEMLKYYGLVIDKTQENRIDYAFHTNVIQNPNKYFTIDKLNEHCFGSLRSYNIMGELRKNDGDYTINYFSLGTHNSNNLFFRCYNKTKEVVEMGYKSFFFDIWYDKGLINFYDKYCLEYAYKYNNYDKIYEAALKFYLEFGQDIIRKKEINLILNDENVTFSNIKKYVRTFMPDVTVILNFEYETKRKYYYYYRDVIDLLPTNCKIEQLKRIFKIVDNKAIFIDMLTSNVVCFQESLNNDSPYLSFWQRLRNLKIKSLSTEKIKANYNTNVDLEKLKSKAVNSIISYSTYKNKNDKTDFTNDIFDLLSVLNDNDIQLNNFENMKVIDIKTGEVLNTNNSVFKEEYLYKKNKKYKQIKNRLNK